MKLKTQEQLNITKHCNKTLTNSGSIRVENVSAVVMWSGLRFR